MESNHGRCADSYWIAICMLNDAIKIYGKVVFHIHTLETKNKAIIRTCLYFNNWMEHIEIVFLNIWTNVWQVEYRGWWWWWWWWWWWCMITDVSQLKEYLIIPYVFLLCKCSLLKW
jgi:hypothetical protein